MAGHDSVVPLLAIAFRHSIIEPNIDAGFERAKTIFGRPLDYEAFRQALDACLRDGCIREPVRLPEGSLQCHWHLELTAKGVEAVRAVLRERGVTAEQLLEHLRNE